MEGGNNKVSVSFYCLNAGGMYRHAVAYQN